jgi:beta-glucosidase
MINKPMICHKILSMSIVCTMLASNSAFAQTQAANEAKINQLIGQMTLEEKVGMIHANSSFTSAGVARLGIPELVMSDGPHGVRMEHRRGWTPDKTADDSCTYLPTGTALAATWSPAMGYEFGKVLGSEAKYRGKDVILGPGINIIRTPLNGRNFEYLSEDPYLVSQMAVGYIKGVQDQGISACVKHYLANNQERDRSTVDVIMSERALREIYLPGFKAAVQEADVHCVMGSYNKFRGQYCTHNQYLINQILKGEFGFQGILISDWGAVHNTREALYFGTDIEMGTEIGMKPKQDYTRFYMADTLLSMARAGLVPDTLLDDKVRRILRVMYNTHIFDKRPPGEFNTKAHQATALKIAQEAMVLLKNDGILPLHKTSLKTIAVIGANADWKHAGAGGSSQVNAKYEITPLQGIRNYIGNNIAIHYAEGYKITRDKNFDPQSLLDQAVAQAKTADVAIVVGGLIRGYSNAWSHNAYDTEGADKPDMFLPFGQDKLIDAVIKANPNTIVVLVGGGAVDVSRWEGKAKGILQAWYAGMEGGNALAQILFGEINPSGKLPMTFPKKLEDSPAHKLGEYPGTNLTVHYNEGIFVGYRYFDTYKVEPQYCFGHGLSYTTFQYDKLKVTGATNSAAVRLTVRNSGKVAGAEVVQVYVKEEKASVERPEKELKAFKKIFLAPGESKVVEISLPESAFQYFDEARNKWVLEPGKFFVEVGSSSRDIRLTGELTL